MEQEDADILVGPLSGDEGIAVANYAKENPDKTFVNGIAGAQDSTLKVQAPNFFRFHPDGAQWSAGLGDYAYNELGWKKAAIIGDDYSFPYTSLAGFVAEYCSIGGDITKRVWAPLGEEDYSSYISQIPDDVDGLYVGIGGSGLINFLKQYKEQKGKIDTEKMMGNVFWDDPLVLAEVGKDLDRRQDLRDDRGGLGRARGGLLHRGPQDQLRRRDRRRRPVGLHLRLLHRHDRPDQAASRRSGATSPTRRRSRRRCRRRTLSGDEAPWGDVKLDDNRQAISNVFLKEIVADKTGDGVPDVKTISSIPEVDQSFGGVFTADTPAPDRENPKCEKGTPPPWVGNAEPVNFGG